MTHTKGPWRWGYFLIDSTDGWKTRFSEHSFSKEDTEPLVLSSDAYGYVHTEPIYVLNPVPIDYGELASIDASPADRALVAAAPDMLGHLKYALEFFRTHGASHLDIALLADVIKTAEGEK